jgi:hypothetical protein
MTDPIEARSYKWPRRYVYAATLIVIAALFVLTFLVIRRA